MHSLVVQFTKFLSGQFTIAFVVNPPDEKLVKSTTLECTTAKALQLLPVYRFYNRHWRAKGNRAQWTRLETKKGPVITVSALGESVDRQSMTKVVFLTLGQSRGYHLKKLGLRPKA